MDKKKMLKIAYAIAQFQDFVGDEDFTEENFEEVEYLFKGKISPEEMNTVMKFYNGYGMDRLDDEIREEYFKD